VVINRVLNRRQRELLITTTQKALQNKLRRKILALRQMYKAESWKNPDPQDKKEGVKNF